MTPTLIVINKHYALLWLLLIVAGSVLEGIALGTGQQGDTLSALVVYGARLDSVGRYFVLAFLCWIFYHWGIAPVVVHSTSPTWRDLIALTVGLLWAYVEARRL